MRIAGLAVLCSLLAQASECHMPPKISGHIRWANGEPAVNCVMVAIDSNDPNAVAYTMTDANGYYEFYVPYGTSGTVMPYGFVDPNNLVPPPPSEPQDPLLRMRL